MKEENVREWGTIHPLGSLAFDTESQPMTESSPTPENLIYHFTSTLAFRKSEKRAAQTATLIPSSKNFEPINTVLKGPSQALSISYGHPRFIEYPESSEDEMAPRRTARPVFSILLAVVLVFVVWYIYHLTGLQLKLKSENNRYQETLSEEKQTATELVSPHIRVLAFQEMERSQVEAKVFWDTTKQICQVYLNNLPESPAREVFHLWYFTKNAQFIPAATFQAENHSAAVKIKLPGDKLAQIDRLIVSLEPPGNYSFPTGRILLRGYLR